MSEDIRESLLSLKELRSVIGLCLHTEATLVENLFPRAYSKQRVEDFCSSMYDLLIGYEQVDRVYSEVCLRFNGGTTYSVVHKQKAVSFLLEDASCIPLIGAAATTFLTDNVEQIGLPLPPRTTEEPAQVVEINEDMWKAYQLEVSGLLGRLVGTASANKLMDRVLAGMGASAQEGLTPSRFREFGLAVVLEIPNRSKQDSLRKELESVLGKYQ